jgi:branched-chain amino acid transport system substrate-binding protein
VASAAAGVHLTSSRSLRRITAAAIASITAAAALAGCASADGSPRPATSGRIVIGMFEPMDAASSGFGVPVAAGADIVVNEINAAGGIRGRKLQLDIQDNACTSADGVTSVQKLLSESPAPSVLVGGLCSGSTLAAEPIVQRSQIPLLVDWASDPEITAEAGVGGNPWVFRWAPNDTDTAATTAQYLASLHTIKKVAIVVSNDTFGLGGLPVIADALEKDGITVVSKDIVDLTSPNFAPIIARIKAEKPDAVALWMTDAPQAKDFYDQYGLAGMASTPLAGQVDMTQPAITQFKLTGFNSGTYSTQLKTAGNKAFLAAWKADGQAISNAWLGWDGYESIEILAAALRSAKSLTPTGIRDSLKSLHYGPTIDGGSIEFDSHNQAHDMIVIEKFTGSDIQTTVFKQGS